MTGLGGLLAITFAVVMIVVLSALLVAAVVSIAMALIARRR